MNVPVTDFHQLSEDYLRIEQAIEYLEKHANTQPELSEIASAVGLSEYHFQRTFSRWAGISPKRFTQFLTKESAVTLVGVVFLLDGARGRLTPRDLLPYLRNRWPLYAGLLAVAGGVLLARSLVLGNVARPFPPLGADILEEPLDYDGGTFVVPDTPGIGGIPDREKLQRFKV